MRPLDLDGEALADCGLLREVAAISLGAESTVPTGVGDDAGGAVEVEVEVEGLEDCRSAAAVFLR